MPRRRKIAGALFLVEAAFVIIWGLIVSLPGLIFTLPLLGGALLLAAVFGLVGMAILSQISYARPVGCLLSSLCIIAYLFLGVSLSLAYGDYGFGPYVALLFAPIFLSSVASSLLLVI
jgi:hypothetical protein